MLVVALGGMVGASSRYAAELAWPVVPGAFPWTTLAVNDTGCVLIGVLMVTVAESRGLHPLVRPFLGVGVLGGFTTFSTYAVQVDSLARGGRQAAALAYLGATLGGALVAVTAGAVLARAARLQRHRAATRRGGS